MSTSKTEQPWYHGSQQELTELRPGSSITQNRAVARVFSHRPSLVSRSDDGSIKHDGTTPGFLYLITERIGADDIYPHPHPINESHWEWLTRRSLQVQLIEQTHVRDHERLQEHDIEELRRMQSAAGEETFKKPG